MNTKVTQVMAADMAEVSRATIVRAIKDGKLSKGSDGKIDVSELMRVYGSDILTPEQVKEKKAKKNGNGMAEDQAKFASENEILKEKLKLAEERLAEKDARIREVTEERDDYKTEARAAKEREMRLLTDQRDKEEAWQKLASDVAALKANQNRGFFEKLFGRKKA